MPEKRDVSLLHDTNGLAILSSRMWRKPITVLVINNHGGGIFSFLPIAEKAEPHILEKYFYYNHTISISKLCAAHGVKHFFAETKLELQEALSTAEQADTDYVIEVASSINSNAIFHRTLRKYASQAASHTLMSLSQLSVVESAQDGFCLCKIAKLEYTLYGINLTAPTTSASGCSRETDLLRQGFILELTLDDGSIGLGEIAPLEIHEEDLQDVEEQLQFLLHALGGATIPYLLPLLRESFSLWIWRVIGVPPCSIFPSVRCGLEMAILNAIASRKKCSLLEVLWPQSDKGNLNIDRPSSVNICALVDSEGTPVEVADVVLAIVEEGFSAVKLKVARRDDPMEDAAVIKEIRRRVGTRIELRVDANRKWTYDAAIEFGFLVKDCGLEYIEEPVQCEDDIVRFCEETGLPVALDETIDKIHGNIPDSLARFTHPGVVALVIKPSVVGGFENAALISLWAQVKGKLAVVSAAFESSISLSSYVQFACYLEMRSKQIPPAFDKKLERSVAHGLGTYKWLKEDVVLDPLVICRQPHNGYLGASIDDADNILRNFQINRSVTSENFVEGYLAMYEVTVELQNFCWLIKVQETGDSRDNNVLLFLHGFLGSSEDWLPIMKGLSRSAKCISVDLPGHGKSKIHSRDGVKAAEDVSLSIEVVAAVLSQLIDKIAPGKVTLVGYSMGARIALYMALRFSGKINGAIVISGSPGLKDVKARKTRAAIDDSRARSLLSFGLRAFVNTWYHGDMWQSFREHPNFKKIVTRRLQHDDVHGLAKALSDLSIGKQPSLWEDLKRCEIPLLFIVGENDTKFKNISKEICDRISGVVFHDTVEVPSCGHAAHLENPLAVVRLLRQFLKKTSK